MVLLSDAFGDRETEPVPGGNGVDPDESFEDAVAFGVVAVEGIGIVFSHLRGPSTPARFGPTVRVRLVSTSGRIYEPRRPTVPA